VTTGTHRVWTDALPEPFKASSLARRNLMQKPSVRFARVYGRSNLTGQTLIVNDDCVLLVKANGATDAIDASVVQLSLCK
jgi:hypothetical protein